MTLAIRSQLRRKLLSLQAPSAHAIAVQKNTARAEGNSSRGDRRGQREEDMCYPETREQRQQRSGNLGAIDHCKLQTHVVGYWSNNSTLSAVLTSRQTRRLSQSREQAPPTSHLAAAAEDTWIGTVSSPAYVGRTEALSFTALSCSRSAAYCTKNKMIRRSVDSEIFDSLSFSEISSGKAEIQYCWQLTAHPAERSTAASIVPPPSFYLYTTGNMAEEDLYGDLDTSVDTLKIRGVSLYFLFLIKQVTSSGIHQYVLLLVNYSYQLLLLPRHSPTDKTYIRTYSKCVLHRCEVNSSRAPFLRR